jgi:hypothetical protein
MASYSDAANLLQSVRNVRAECDVGQSKFKVAVKALDSLCLELEYYTPRLNNPGSVVNNDQRVRSSLERCLSPCCTALNDIVAIRRRYRGEMSMTEKLKWKSSDGEKFNKAVSSLLQATNQFRETLREAQDDSWKTSKVQPSSMELKVCQNGAGCRTPECKFPHPDASPCQNGVGCTTPNCSHQHPRPPHCENGSGCRVPDCKFPHPDAPPCRKGASCTTLNCSYQHPRVLYCNSGAGCRIPDCKSPHPDAPPCRIGAGCTTSNCSYQHPKTEYCRNGSGCRIPD